MNHKSVYNLFFDLDSRQSGTFSYDDPYTWTNTKRHDQKIQVCAFFCFKKILNTLWPCYFVQGSDIASVILIDFWLLISLLSVYIFCPRILLDLAPSCVDGSFRDSIKLYLFKSKCSIVMFGLHKKISKSKWTTSNFNLFDSANARVAYNCCLSCFTFTFNYLMLCRFKIWPKLLLIFWSNLSVDFRKLAQEHLENNRRDWVARKAKPADTVLWEIVLP